MHLIKLFTTITITSFLIVSCNSDTNTLQRTCFVEHGKNEYDTDGGLLYLYDKIGEEYYYSLICSNSRPYLYQFGVNDTYSNDNYVKLHFKGDSIDNLIGQYPIIQDSNTYIVYNYDDTLNTFSDKEFIKSGEIEIYSTYCSSCIPNSISFKGKTFRGTPVSLNYTISNYGVSSKINRRVLGEFLFRDQTYFFSEISVGDSSKYYNLNLYDFDVDNYKKTNINFIIRKSENDSLIGSYYSNLNDLDMFYGNLFITSYNKDSIWINDYINQGQITIKRNINEKYNIVFDVKTYKDESIRGSLETEIFINNN
jgi:hypothetical protein